MRLSDKVAIVTGAASGIGRAIAIGYSKEGANIAIGDVNLEEAELVVDEIKAFGRRAIAVETDVSDSSNVKNLIKTTIRELGEINILVNNAAIFGKPPLNCLEIKENTWDEIMAVNLKGTLLCSQYVVKEIIKQNRGGKIINMSSISGVVPGGHSPSYQASKAGVIMLTKAMAIEFAKYEINVNAIGPGLIETPLTKPLLESPKNRKYAQKAVPLGRIGQTEDVVGPAIFLASKDSDFITGQTIFVDGGFLYLHPTIAQGIGSRF